MVNFDIIHFFICLAVTCLLRWSIASASISNIPWSASQFLFCVEHFQPPGVPSHHAVSMELNEFHALDAKKKFKNIFGGKRKKFRKIGKFEKIWKKFRNLKKVEKLEKKSRNLKKLRNLEKLIKKLKNLKEFEKSWQTWKNVKKAEKLEKT